MRANTTATFSKAWRLCYLVFVFFASIHLFNSYHTPNDSTARVIPSFSLVGKPKLRSVNAPHRPVTTWLNHGSVCVFPGPYQLGSSSFQLNRALPVSSSPSISQKGSVLFSSYKENAVPQKTKEATEFGVKLFKGRLIKFLFCK